MMNCQWFGFDAVAEVDPDQRHRDRAQEEPEPDADVVVDAVAAEPGTAAIVGNVRASGVLRWTYVVP